MKAENPAGPRGFDSYDVRLGDVMRGERATLGKSLLDVQRELKIKATYIAAIENADPTAFETPGFVAGYVRSYARYLGLDPEWAYRKFCEEGDFATVSGMDAAASAPKPKRKAAPEGAARDPLADPNATFVPRGEAVLARVEPGAIGSVAVLLALIGALGYGGWSVLEEIQKVRLAPVDQAPGVIAEVDPLAAATGFQVADSAGVATPSADALDRLYRPEPLDVPELIARDGPISTLAPGALSALGEEALPQAPRLASSALPDAVDHALAVALGEDTAEPAADGPRVVADNAPEVVIFAVRPAWVRVTSAQGTVLLEKILDAGERYVLPATEEPPLLRTGYAGAIYFAVNGEAYGPAGEGASVVSNVALAQEQLKSSYQVADLTDDPDLASVVAQAILPVEAE